MRFVALAAILAAAPTLANAADYLPLPPVSQIPGPGQEFSWDGLYGGIHVGAATGDFSASGLGDELTRGAYRNYNVEPRVEGLFVLPKTSDQQPMLGGFIGHNWAFDDAVVGIEAEYNKPKSKLSGSATDAYAYRIDLSTTDVWNVQAAAQSRFSLTDYAVLKARGGYAIGRFLPYASIGLAVGRGRIAASVNGTVRERTYTDATQTTLVSDSGDLGISYGIAKQGYLTGLALGLGVDYAPVDNLFVRAQYQYVGFADFKGQRANLNMVSLGAGVKY